MSCNFQIPLPPRTNHLCVDENVIKYILYVLYLTNSNCQIKNTIVKDSKYEL